MIDVIQKITGELRLKRSQVEGTVALLNDEATVPFIARYRKERTGGLDEVQILAVKERLKYLTELEQRRAFILKAIGDAGKMTPELQAAIENAPSKAELEDVYMPFRTRRRTRSNAAKQKGLEPLAQMIWKQELTEGKAEDLAQPFINAEKGVKDLAEALTGARDIIAEWVSEDAACRKTARDLLLSQGKVTAKAREGVDLPKGKFAGYAQFSEPLTKIPSHRLLAVLRGSSEKQLSVVIEAPRAKTLEEIKAKLVKPADSVLKPDLILAIEEAYDRLLAPSLDNEVRQDLKHSADLEAIEVFARNLRALLLQPPLGEKAVLGIDPGLRTGCKLAVLDATGKLLGHAVVYPDKSEEEKKNAAATLVKLIQEHRVTAIAIGNGTGGREADVFVRDVLKEHGIKDVCRVAVNESGASIYSASATGREELPDVDLTVRGTVSIGRRLQDPLAELVKLEPKSIGVGQYQHDVDQNLLKQKLEEVVESCVNRVGVDANTASIDLLRYIAGIGPKLAKSVIETRNLKGGFKSREDLREIPGLGAKLFQQCAGFLRVRNAENPLDNSAVHPEAYPVVEAMAASLNKSVKDLLGNEELIKQIDLNKFKTGEVGEYTLADIAEELKKPGRDPRSAFVNPEFNDEVRGIKDLQDGMVLNGVVTNLTAFGAFVDIGVHQDGLVHISAITHKFIRDPSEALAIGQHVKVKVLSVDQGRKRISLSIKALQEAPPPRAARASSGPRKPRAAAGAPAEAGKAPAPGESRPPRTDRPRQPRPPRPAGQPAPAGAPAAAGTGAIPAPGQPPMGEGRPGRPPRREGSRDRRPEGGRERPRTPAKPVAPGAPDYSKFFVKGKRKEKERERRPGDGSGASRDEVREVMRKQQSSGTTLGDLFKKAGVTPKDE